MRIRTVALAFSLLLASALLLPATAAAQEASVGDRVRVLSPTARGAFVLRGVRGDSLELGALADSSTFLVPLSTIERLDVRRPRARGRGAVRGFGIGLVIGAVTGLAIGLAEGDDEEGFIVFTAEEKALLAGIGLGGLGGAAGAVVGAIAPGSRWERVSASARARIAPAPGGGGVAVSLTLPLGGDAPR